MIKLGFCPGDFPKICAALDDADYPWEPGMAGRGAAVSVLFVPPEPGIREAASLVLTVRSVQVRSHKGQIAFAGGRVDATDRSPRDTAIRELSEEIGLGPDLVKVIGAMESIAALDGTPIVPVVMVSDLGGLPLLPNPREVSEVLFVPWTQLTPSANRRFRFNLFGGWRESDQFSYGGHTIWGLTAKIIANLSLDNFDAT